MGQIVYLSGRAGAAHMPDPGRPLPRILLAYPDARIFLFSESGIAQVKYTETEHYQITKDFLNRHERMLDLLLSAEDADLEAKRRK